MLCSCDCQHSTMQNYFSAKLMFLKLLLLSLSITNKIMMNASMETMPATSMHTVQTLWVPITVPARRDTLAMDSRVQVHYN